MIVLLCALTVGQVQPLGPLQDVAVLRDRYERAQTAYEKLEESCARAQAMYEKMCERSRESEAKFKEMEARLAASGNSRAVSSVQQMQESRERFREMRVRQRLMMQNSLNQFKQLLIQLKQRAEQARWDYERVAGRLREHWA